MLLPIKWLNEYVKVDDLTPSELSDKLISCGFEIEGIIDLSAPIKGVVVGKILDIKKHENADKLLVCKVDTGKAAPLQIVTGAHNIAVGDVVPVCTDGAILPDGTNIKTGELRGVLSEGMFCGGSELNLTEHDYPNAGVNGILILDKNAKIGTDINVEIGNDDIVLDVSITANRTDANCIYNLARETAAVLNRPLKPLNLEYKVGAKGDIGDDLAVKNLAPDLCPRYIAKEVRDIKIERSPKYLRDRLRAVGIRPINNIVDITNYVLTEVGQPMHAFDLKAIEGGEIVVRRAVDDEKIIALDDKEYALKSDNLVIANVVKPMAIAGVMGGAGFSIADDTKTIVFESARFARDSVRKTSRALNLRSDSSARFEKGIDFYAQKCGMNRALALIDELKCGNIVGGELDNFPAKPDKKVVKFTSSDITGILGITVPDDEIVAILNNLTIATKLEKGVFSSEIPQFREDIYGVNDLAEEIIRMYGYDKITASVSPQTYISVGGKTERQKLSDKAKNILVGKGACEIITYSFITPKAFDLLELSADNDARKCVKILNPLGEDFSVMRTTLAHSMIKTLATNVLRGNKEAKLFEIAKVYLPKSLPLKEYPAERETLAIGAYGTDFYGFKAMIEDMLNVFRFEMKFARSDCEYLHPTRCANIFDVKTGALIGTFGEVSDKVSANYGVDKRLYFADIDFDYVLDNAKTFGTFKVISRYPATERDLALVCAADTEAAFITDTIKEAAGDILISANVFDVYTGGQVLSGKKSVAVKLTFQSSERTLKDTEVNSEIDAVLAALEGVNIYLR